MTKKLAHNRKKMNKLGQFKHVRLLSPPAITAVIYLGSHAEWWSGKKTQQGWVTHCSYGPDYISHIEFLNLMKQGKNHCLTVKSDLHSESRLVNSDKQKEMST